MRRLRHTLPAASIALSLLVLCACGASGSSSTSSHRTPKGTFISSPVPVSSVNGGPGPAAAANATNRLALSLLPALGGTGNVVLSPYSIETALAMVAQGARGQTATQIAAVLGAPDAAMLAASNRALLVALRKTAGSPTGSGGAHGAPKLDDANSVWLQSGFKVLPAFSASLSANFGVAPQLVDFGTAPDTARKEINSWVAQQTQQLIPELMPPGSITAQTLLVLANAIYLKAHWANPFLTSMTSPDQFFPASGPPVQVPFMSQEQSPYAYSERAGYEAIELPYLNSSLTMLAIMPSPGTIAGFEHELTPARLQSIVDSLHNGIVDLAMPKLKLSVNTDLSAELSALGMPIAFEDGADFTGIAPQPPLKIGVVEHAAVLKVDEAGTTAAGATGIGIVGSAAPLQAASIKLDHPFLLFLRDTRTGAVLFAARVANPAQS
ncbi:MAG: serpin family protein [Solirubrobacteraceae bacterium]